MAQQLIGLGTSANDKTGDPARTAFDKCNDNFTELYASVAALGSSIIRVATTCDGTTDQVISYPSTRTDSPPMINDYEGIGITLKAWDEDGFTISSLSAGNFIYLQ